MHTEPPNFLLVRIAKEKMIDSASYYYCGEKKMYSSLLYFLQFDYYHQTTQ